MLGRIVHAIAIGFIAGLACLLLATILPAIHVPVVSAVGGFFGDWAWPIGVVVGLLDFATGGLAWRFPA